MTILTGYAGLSDRANSCALSPGGTRQTQTGVPLLYLRTHEIPLRQRPRSLHQRRCLTETTTTREKHHQFVADVPIRLAPEVRFLFPIPPLYARTPHLRSPTTERIPTPHHQAFARNRRCSLLEESQNRRRRDTQRRIPMDPPSRASSSFPSLSRMISGNIHRRRFGNLWIST